ncbi:MAG: hypothetical protein GTN78_11360, partial [Gemmatimonadales bacterium]|nr:hypothetical protein [Gemmatimonadales bacterium]
YDTAGFVADANAWPVFGLDQGFGHYEYERLDDARSVKKAFVRWLNRRETDGPFFSFLLFRDVRLWY